MEQALAVRSLPVKYDGPHADPQSTHERFIHAIRDAVVTRLDPATRDKVLAAKLVYGIGRERYARGGTFYDAWRNGSTHDLIEISAAAEESALQIAGTTVHEIAHVVAHLGGHGGHGKEWKSAAHRCGLKLAEAGGQAYAVEHFDPALWTLISQIPAPGDGIPLFRSRLGFNGTIRPCPIGYGTRGGTSRGVGSGSRMVLWLCKCPNPPKLRAARSAPVSATCNVCLEPLAPYGSH